MPAIGDFIDKEKTDGLPVDMQAEQMDTVEQVPASAGFDLSILKAQTGAGSISEYIEHPLNFNGSNGVGRIIRGLTGMLGELNFAVVDILLGVLELAKDRKKAVIANVGH